MTVNKKKPSVDLSNDFLSLAKPAQRALANAGFNKLSQLSKITEKELLALHGMGPNAMKNIKKSLAVRDLELLST
jgi:DNA-directed RNA polymerase alpha subunit